MNLTYFHQYFTTPAGSAGTRSYEFAKALVNAGHNVHIVCGSFDAGVTGLSSEFVNRRRTGLVEGIQVTEFDLSYSNKDGFLSRTMKFLSYAGRSVWLALRSDADIVFATSTPLTAALPGIAARWLRGKKFVFEVRDLWPELPRAMGVITNPVALWLMGVLEWCAYNSAHACVGLSPGIVDGIRKRTTSKQIALIPNGSDLSRFALDEIEPAEIDGVRSEDLVCMFTGAHGIANGLGSVIDAALELSKRGVDDVKFVFVGNGMEKPALKQKVSENNLSNCIFVDSVPKTELRTYLKRADVALMILKNIPAFYYGTSPNKFFDYLSAGKAIVTNYPGWLADMIEEHQLGLAVRPQDPIAFADALIEMANNSSFRRQAGENSLRLAQLEYSRTRLVHEFVSFIEKQESTKPGQ